MTTFVFDRTVPAEKINSSALGTPEAKFIAATDIGKAVKLAAANNHILAVGGDEIDGFVTSVEPFTVNNGYAFGGVQTWGRVEAVIGANQGVTPAAVGDYVVADTQPALGNAGALQSWSAPGTVPGVPTGPTASVKTGTPSKRLWRIIRILSGAGAAGSVVLLERD